MIEIVLVSVWWIPQEIHPCTQEILINCARAIEHFGAYKLRYTHDVEIFSEAVPSPPEQLSTGLPRPSPSLFELSSTSQLMLHISVQQQTQ